MTIGRKVPEWIGATNDTPPPPRVRKRVFDAYGGVCQESMRPIGPGDGWQADHIIPVGLGGENRESNLQPVLVDAHKVKTRRDKAQIAKANRVRKAHLGIATHKRPIPGSRNTKFKKRIDGTTILRE